MTDAYQCDWCEEYIDGEPWFSGETALTQLGEQRKWDLCQGCWEGVKAYLKGNTHRLANAEPATIPDDAERDSDGEAVFPEAEE